MDQNLQILSENILCYLVRQNKTAVETSRIGRDLNLEPALVQHTVKILMKNKEVASLGATEEAGIVMISVTPKGKHKVERLGR